MYSPLPFNRATAAGAAACGREIGVDIPKNEFTGFFDVGTEFPGLSRWNNMVSRDIITDLDNHAAIQRRRHRGVSGRFADIGSPVYRGLPGGKKHQTVIIAKERWQGETRLINPQVPWVRQRAREGGRSGSFWAHQIDVCIQCSASALKIPVVRPDACGIAARRLTVSDAKIA